MFAAGKYLLRIAGKEIVEVPYFMACNTRSIEVEQVTLGKDTTWLAVRLYGMQGDKVRIDSTAVLRASGKDYGYFGEIPVLPGMSGRIFPLPVKWLLF